MKRLEECGIELFNGMRVYWPQSQYIEEIILEFHEPETFSTSDGKVCWITKEGKCYLGFMTKETMDALREAGYKEVKFFVPFSTYDEPLLGSETYRQLRAQHRKEIADNHT